LDPPRSEAVGVSSGRFEHLNHLLLVELAVANEEVRHDGDSLLPDLDTVGRHRVAVETCERKRGEPRLATTRLKVSELTSNIAVVTASVKMEKGECQNRFSASEEGAFNLRSDKEDDLAILEDGADDGDVGEMGSSSLGMVGDNDVALAKLSLEVLGLELDGVLH